MEPHLRREQVESLKPYCLEGIEPEQVYGVPLGVWRGLSTTNDSKRASWRATCPTSTRSRLRHGRTTSGLALRQRTTARGESMGRAWPGSSRVSDRTGHLSRFS